MRNIVMIRIDERLIHGQVMTSWIKRCDATSILIVDDMSATNAFLKRILLAAAPKNMDVQIKTVAEAVDYLKEDAVEGEKLFVLTKVPKPLLVLLDNGVSFKEIILGNMGGGPGRTNFNKNVNASDSEIQDFKDIISKGVEMYCQMVPTDSKEDIRKLLK